MLDKNTLDTLIKKLAENLPPGLEQFRQELESLFRGVLQSTLEKLAVVTQEEFDAEVKALHKTRRKLEELSKQVETLEKEFSSKRSM